MTKTPNINLNVPDYQDERWDIPVNENWNLLDTAIAGKQATLTFDTTPTSGSSNPVISGGIYTALNAKQDVATAVNYDNISNCITEIPQDIKLELNNGTLTLKAGSKVYVPNGFEADGVTPKFDVVTINSDITTTGYLNSNIMVFYYLSTNIIGIRIIDDCVSGSSTTKTDYYNFYNTITNKLGSYGASGTLESYLSLPICICKSNNGAISSIDQVFNGFGYIGSTVFALPVVKGLSPNGRNVDGSLKNIDVILSNVLLRTFTNTATTEFAIGTNGIYQHPHYTLKDDNYLYYENGTKVDAHLYVAGEFSRESGVITSLTPKTAFHAVDYNDFEKAMLKEDWVKVSTVPASPDSSKLYYIPEN